MKQKPEPGTHIVSLYLAQRGRCFHCLQPMLLTPVRKRKSGNPNNGWTREHMVPLSKGGPRGMRNAVLAHIWCNNKRGNADPTKEMLERFQRIQEAAQAIPTKEAKRVAMDPAARGTYLATYDYKYYPSEDEPRFDPRESR